MSVAEFVILCGALGSGKTTLLEAWLQQGGASSTAVIVNDAGDINVDGVILSASAGGVPMATLANGCVCCSLTDDLAFTIQELVNTRAEAGQAPFERIVLECSGLSRPGRVLRSLAPLAALRLSVHIVSTYDALHPIRERRERAQDGVGVSGGVGIGVSRDVERDADEDEAFENGIAQLTAAHTVVLNKLDLVGADTRREAFDTARRLNPLAGVIDILDGTERARAAFALRSEGVPRSVDEARAAAQLPAPDILLPAPSVHSRVRIFRAAFSEAVAPDADDFVCWLEDMAGMAGGRLLRTKALLFIPEDAAVVVLQSVGSTFGAPRRLPMPPTAANSQTEKNANLGAGAIFITRDLTLDDMRGVFAPFSVDWVQLKNMEMSPPRWRRESSAEKFADVSADPSTHPSRNESDLAPGGRG